MIIRSSLACTEEDVYHGVRPTHEDRADEGESSASENVVHHTSDPSSRLSQRPAHCHVHGRERDMLTDVLGHIEAAKNA
eukprot:2728971-Pyramimonas_sp.AAC.1